MEFKTISKINNEVIQKSTSWNHYSFVMRTETIWKYRVHFVGLVLKVGSCLPELAHLGSSFTSKVQLTVHWILPIESLRTGRGQPVSETLPSWFRFESQGGFPRSNSPMIDNRKFKKKT